MNEELAVLVVEDNPADLDLVLEMLSETEPMRFKVESASRLSGAIERLEGGGIDVVLLDLGLPDSQGLDTLRAVANAAPHVPIVVFTGHDDEETGQAAVREGAQDYLVKELMPGRMLGRALRFAVERKRAEQTLADEAVRRRILVDQSRDGIVVLDHNGKVYEANQRFAEMLGYTPEEVRQLHVWDWDTEWTREQLLESIRSVDAAGDHFETRHRRKDGTVCDVEISSNGAICGGQKLVFCVCRDITERKRAEEEVRLNEERLRRLVNILQHRAESTTEFLDYALEEAIQLTQSKIGYIYHYHQDRREFVLNTWSRNVMQECTIAEPESLYQLEKTGIWGEAVRQRKPIIVNDFAASDPLKKGYPDGHAHLHKFMTIPVFDGDSIIAVVGLANKQTDYNDKDVLQLTLLVEAVWKVLDQRRSQERIVHLNQVLRAIRDINKLIVREREPEKLIEQACSLLVETRGYHSALIVLTDPAGVPQTFSEAGIGEAFGALAEQLRSGVLPPCCDRARDLTGPYLVTDRADTCASCLLGSSYPAYDAICIHLLHEGTSYGFMMVSLALGLGSDEEEQSLFAEMAGDLAFALHASQLEKDAVQAEEKQRVAEAQLRQAQKMEALGTLSGGIAHDFNNILGIVLGYTEMARLDTLPGTPLRDNLQEVMTAAHRAKDLVKQILAFSRQVGLVKQPVSMGLLIKESLKMLRASIPTTIEIRSQVSGEAMVQSDPTQIHQVLMNLCTNAAHAMREHGGVLEVAVRDVELTSEAIALHNGLEPGAYVELSVKDTGHGIDPAIQDRVFDPFFTTKEVNEGTGLGLAVVHGIVTSHAGSIEVSSNPNEGAVFRVLLPAATSKTAVSPAPEETLPSGSEHILLVDDEPSLAMVGQQALERLGYRVAYQTSSLAAVETFRSHQSAVPFELLITDMTMPQMTGVELATVLRRLQPDLPVIVCSGFSEKIDAEKSRSLGIEGFLMKPIVLSELAVSIREALNKKLE